MQMPPKMADTFAVVKRGRCTVEDIYKQDRDRESIGITAIHRRLERLMEWGLVVRVLGENATHFYSAVKKEESNGRKKRRSAIP